MSKNGTDKEINIKTEWRSGFLLTDSVVDYFHGNISVQPEGWLPCELLAENRAEGAEAHRGQRQAHSLPPSGYGDAIEKHLQESHKA